MRWLLLCGILAEAASEGRWAAKALSDALIAAKPSAAPGICSPSALTCRSNAEVEGRLSALLKASTSLAEAVEELKQAKAHRSAVREKAKHGGGAAQTAARAKARPAGKQGASASSSAKPKVKKTSKQAKSKKSKKTKKKMVQT
eukprot:CAMPEP_0204311240 /NCGR_PEP_ID=MMETSP0469-20131031/2222_1 /ASSEMBLY_ACC=CAM_ASM_000384 /TAXON_ID=2969 /ORGANISM="Oxyrrhis marina" /LENGTH=143 /DNA_ID=CAMNT_0051291161 /DNA_START=9 /DNA_END=440 /DNA_ORIENTATION=+